MTKPGRGAILNCRIVDLFLRGGVELTTQQMKKSGYLRIFVSYYKPHWKLFALDMACALCICMVDLAFPIVSRSSMQTLLPQKLFSAFFVVMALLAGAYVLKSVFYFIVTYWGHLLGVRMEADIRRDLFHHMQDLSFSFYDKNRTGQLMSRVTGDLFEITVATTNYHDISLVATGCGSKKALFDKKKTYKHINNQNNKFQFITSLIPV